MEVKQKGLQKKYHKQSLARMEQLVFPLIGALPITEITIPDVVRVIEKISKRGTIETAKKMKQFISQTFRYASQRGLCLHNPAADLRDILPSTEEKHHASVAPYELPALLQAIDARENDMSKAAMQLLALTFVRTGELIGAQWEEIFWEREEWHIPKERMKMKRPHVVPLARQTLAILRELHKKTGEKPFLFYSPASTSKHISNGTVLMALRRMGYPLKPPPLPNLPKIAVSDMQIRAVFPPVFQRHQKPRFHSQMIRLPALCLVLCFGFFQHRSHL